MENYEESVAFLGTWGPFQRRILFLISLTAVPSGYNILCIIFLLATPSHHCYIPTRGNLSAEWIAANIPVQVAGQQEMSSCSRYELGLVQNLSALGASPNLELVHNHSAVVLSPGDDFSGLKQEACKDGWTYSTEYYQSTVVSEFNLVCDNQWKQPLSSLIYFMGSLCGCLASGPISDRFGRKPVLFSAIAILSVFSLAMAFAPSWPIFSLLLFMMGLGQISSYIVGYVIGSELLVGRTRVFFCNLWFPFFYVFSMMLLPGTAYFVRNWRHLSMILSVPGLACIPLWWMVPESHRWLVSHGYLQEAEHLLRLAALENKVEAPRVIFAPTKVEKSGIRREESLSFLDLLRTENIRNITFMLWLIWFSLNVSYFGLQFNTSSLYGNPYLNYLLLSVIEFPAYAASWLAVRSFPRRLSCISFILLGAVALLLIQITLSLHSHPAVTLSLVMLGKFGILAGISVLYIFTGELSPTVIRNTALSSSATFSRVGSSVSPFLLQLAAVSSFLPWIIVGSLSLLSVLACFFLPETFRHPLPDTIQQMPHIQGFKWPRAPKSRKKDNEKSANDNEIICTTSL